MASQRTRRERERGGDGALECARVPRIAIIYKLESHAVSRALRLKRNNGKWRYPSLQGLIPKCWPIYRKVVSLSSLRQEKLSGI